MTAILWKNLNFIELQLITIWNSSEENNIKLQVTKSLVKINFVFDFWYLTFYSSDHNLYSALNRNRNHNLKISKALLKS